MSLKCKIDFAVVFSVKNANPNGDPLNGNRPRTNYDRFGEVSDVCLKRKLRNRLQDMGQPILVQSDERRGDEHRSIKSRVDGNAALKKVDKPEFARIACASWMDVRSFGQVFAFGKANDENAVSIGVRGPVTIHSAVSVSEVEVTSIQITKSVNSVTEKDPDKKGPDTMGLKHRVDFGLYVTYGSINTQLASLTGFTDEDAALILEALRSLFENDSSSARPDGSMEVVKVFWWKHNCPTGQYSSAKVHRSLQVTLKDGVTEPRTVGDYVITVNDLEGLTPEQYDGV